MKSISYICLSVLAAYSGAAHATPLSYTPINPSFGGSPLNSGHLMAIATAQKPKEKKASASSSLSASQSFARRITDSVLSRVSSQIADQIYGENPRDSGSFIIGDSRIDFHTEGQDVVLVVTDSTGSTTVKIPKPTA